MNKTFSHWIFVSLLAILAIDATSFGIVLPLLPKLVGGEHSQATIITKVPGLIQGLMLAIFPLTSMLGTACLGYLADKLGRKPILTLSLFGTSLGLGLTAVAILSRSLSLLLLGRALTGILGASQPLAQATVTDIAPPSRKALMLGWVAVAMTVGMLAGPLIGGLLVKPWLPLGLALPFVVAALLACLNAGFLLWVFPETYVPVKQAAMSIKGIDPANKSRGAEVENSKPQVAGMGGIEAIKVLGDSLILPKLIAFTGLELAWSWYFQGIAVVLAPLKAWSPAHTAFALAGLGILMSLGLSLIFPLWLKRCKVRQISQQSLYLIGLAWLISLLGHRLSFELLTALIITIAVGIAYTALLTELSDAIGRQRQGWLMGFAASLLALAWAISGLGLGFSVGHPRLWVSIGFGVSLLTILTYHAKFGWQQRAHPIDAAFQD